MSLGFHALTNTRPSHQRVGALSLFTLAGLVVGFGTQPAIAQRASQAANSVSSVNSDGKRPSGQAAVSGKLLRAKLGKEGSVEYLIEHPTWRESKAIRVVDPNQPNLNIEKTIFARLVVGVENEGVLKNAIDTVAAALGTNRPGSHTFKPFLGEPGVFVVQANSVEDAIQFANEITQIDGVKWAEVDYQGQVENKGASTLLSDVINDPSADDQWHVLNPNLPPFDNDHNILPVYDRGITGSGVVVGILEAVENSFYRVDEFGTTFIHPDLAGKLNEELSIETFPFNVDYSHGVSVAGLVGAEGDNGINGAGVAYGAQLASLRNGSQIDSGQSFGHELRDIDIINNSWGPVLIRSVPATSTGKFLDTLPDDYEITIPQIVHQGVSRSRLLGLDQGIRLGRNRKGRIFVFAAGNGSHFQGFSRLALGNAISLPGIGVDSMNVPGFGYLDITGLSPDDDDNDGIPDVFLLNGMTTGIAPSGDPDAMSWRWSGHLGERVEYNEMASMSRTFAIASVGMSNDRSGYSTTGTSVFASAYAQDTILDQEFTPEASWGTATFGQGLVTLEQDDGVDSDAAWSIDCNVDIGTSFVDDDTEACMFNGTSAAAPVAAGVMALMLEANPNLSIRDIQHIIQQTSTIVNFDPTNSYWPSVILGLGLQDNDDGSPPTPTFWTTNSAGVRHSDEYGFGIINADAAVEAALTWPGSGQLILLDSGQVQEGDEGFFDDGAIEDATFTQAAVISENLETNVLNPGTRARFILNCVRDNLTIEGIELTVTITGDGAGDLLIALQSPRGTVSPLALPRGDSNGLTDLAYAEYTFTTYKHWGELSGGTWELLIQDFRPDEDSPEGTPPTDPIPPMPEPEDFGVEQVTYLGPFGLPGNDAHTEKTLVSYRLKIYGTDSGQPVFDGCPILQTACPADLDGNGIVDVTDLQIYINWYLNNNALADLDGDGDVDFTDLTIFRGLWIPGFCNTRNDPFVNGRPRPGGTGTVGDNDPVIRPI